jgi:lipooligosaccharide transport system permease protein
MSNSHATAEPPRAPAHPAALTARRSPPIQKRVVAVWFRHVRVYGNFFFANATPAVFEPIFFLLAIGYGVGRYIEVEFNGLPYVEFMVPGLLAMTSLYTAAFEASYGTFIRLRYQKTYQGMIATPVTRTDIFLGELLWCATKGLLFSFIVCSVLAICGAVRSPWAIVVPLIGFVSGLAFGGLSYIVTSFIRNINHFQYYFTIVVTPLVFFSGLMFPVEKLPYHLEYLAYALPMFHVIETFRLATTGWAHVSVDWAWACPFIVVVLAVLFGILGVRRMVARLQG